MTMKSAFQHFFTISAVCAGLLLVGSGSAAPPPAKVKPLSSYDPQVKALLAKMTIQEKVGQMTQPDITALRDPSDVENLFLGSVLSGGNADPVEGNSLSA